MGNAAIDLSGGDYTQASTSEDYLRRGRLRRPKTVHSAPLRNTLIRQTSCFARRGLVNQVQIALTAVAGAIFIAGASSWLWSRIRKSGGPAEIIGEACRAAFEQSPNGILMANAETLRIMDANLALQRILGFSLEELLRLDLSQVFTDDGEDREVLLRKLRDPNPRVPFQIRQRCKDGSLLSVETRGHRLDLATQEVLVFTTDDVTVRR
jgi:PAS domain S-box-containing protein